jgi:hypothetical protein
MGQRVTFGRIASAAALLPLLACVREYRPPALAQPQAVVKVRLTYPTLPAAELEQLIMVDGDAVRDAAPPVPATKAVSSKPIPIRPGTVRVTVQATYFHNRVTTHAETYETTQEAPCGGSTCVQTVPHTRAVNHVERIDDATCVQAVKLDAKAGESYLLEYDFEADQRCTLRCFRQGRGAKVACDEAGKP